jgi:methylenetetrahydrofolate--tRNA-(uracil-5-)-methyltransferase
MNVNFGLFPPVDAPKVDDEGRRLKGKDKTRAKKLAMTRRARADFADWIASAAPQPLAAE